MVCGMVKSEFCYIEFFQWIKYKNQSNFKSQGLGWMDFTRRMW